jgi:hypothetical protein
VRQHGFFGPPSKEDNQLRRLPLLLHLKISSWDASFPS